MHLFLGGLAALSAAALTVHCGDSAGSGAGPSGGTESGTGTDVGAGAGGPGSGTGPGGPGAGGEFSGFDAQTKDYSAEQFYEDDPPPLSCDGGGVPPPPPGGTPECPDDKNLEGCPCDTVGEKAACWPGLRKNRNRGICHDGTTTCRIQGESAKVWGPCEGAQLPTGTTGKEACLCFSAGHWFLENTTPCFYGNGQGEHVAVSTIPQGEGQLGKCPDKYPTSPPTTPWSKNTLKVDCTGFFKLCYAIKAGSYEDPKPTDCQMTEVCTEAHYAPANASVEFPELPGWLSEDKACVKQFMETGGYGEMTVDGQSDECEKVQKLFLRVKYCPLHCNQNPSAPECQNCGNGAGGDF